jgi:ribosomal protein S15P/S13E
LYLDARMNTRVKLEQFGQGLTDLARTDMSVTQVFATLMHRFSISYTTVKRWIRRLREAGLILTLATGRLAADAVKSGSQPAGKPAHNEVAVYLLTVPRSHVLEPENLGVPAESRGEAVAQARVSTMRKWPTSSPEGKFLDSQKESFSTHASAQAREEEPKPSIRRPRLLRYRRHSSYPIHQAPGASKSAQRQAAGRVADEHMSLGYLSNNAIAALCRPFFAAGWTPADVLHSLNHRPGGSPHAGFPLPAELVLLGPKHHRLRLEAIARFRLGLFLGQDGAPAPSMDAERAAQVRTERAAARRSSQAAYEAMTAQKSPVQLQRTAAGIASVREHLRRHRIDSANARQA